MLVPGHDVIVTTAPPAPSVSDVIAVFDSLLAGSLSRSDASDWAMRWVAAMDPGIDDEAVWDALTLLGKVDLTHGVGQPFLYPDDQVAEWRADLG